jgi:hypothetical protein
LQKVPARLATEGITMHNKASGYIFPSSKPFRWRGEWPSLKNMV